MSHTILYLADKAFTASVNARTREMIKSRAAFEAFVGAEWGGEVRYAHSAFLTDARKQRAETRDVYYLAHPLLNQAPGAVRVHLDVELLRLLEGDGLPYDEYQDEEEEDTDLPKPVFRLLQAGSFDMSGSEREAKRAVAERGLRGLALEQAFLLNKLCNRRALRLRPDPRETAFPIWVAAGWDNYEGHLGATEMAKLDPAPAASLFSLLRRTVAAVAPNDDWVLPTVDQLLAARETLRKMGRGATCIAISSI